MECAIMEDFQHFSHHCFSLNPTVSLFDWLLMLSSVSQLDQDAKMSLNSLKELDQERS